MHVNGYALTFLAAKSISIAFGVTFAVAVNVKKTTIVLDQLSPPMYSAVLIGIGNSST